MSKDRPPRLPKPVLMELEGLDWVLANGSKHWRLLVGGRQVMVVQHGGSNRRGDIHSTENMVARLRRFRRQDDAR